MTQDKKLASPKTGRPRRFARQPDETTPGVEPSTPATDTAVAPPPSPEPKVTKTDQVLALLRRDDGATLAELVAATGWLPHTTRAALTGLRKKGHVIDKSKRGDATCYRIVEVS